ncbi:MAG: hypothetical protein J7623_28940 [Chitinophaga sp.]|uniref:hypothetical protein n=1 Tax=Chitinophaga sp. TaxID=1869181 RepID=UPI001B01A6F8|nr:hypothetical protein [Chitinophaga sp.]MBO9732705.1 hypothetical protein [Chitinophaga sp.]
MRKLILGFAALTMLISSCKKKDKKETVTPANDWYITTSIATQVRDGIVTKNQDSVLYTYNADKTLHTAEEFSVDNGLTYYDLLTFVYDNGKLVKLNRQNGRVESPATILEFRYAGNLLTRSYAPGQATTNYDSLVYENNKVVALVKVRSGKIDKILEYTWDGNSVATEKQFNWDVANHLKVLSLSHQYGYNDVANARKTLAFPYYLLGDQGGSAHLLSAREITNRSTINTLGAETDFISYTRDRDNQQLTVADTSWYKATAGGTKTAGYITRYKYTDLSK